MATYLGHQEDSSGNILLPTPHSMATQIEFGTTASQAYAKGAYVVFNNRLCKASTAIASGDTLAIGTNLVQCSIGSELNSHLQAPNGSEFYFDYKDNKPGFYPSASKVASEFVPFGGSVQLDTLSPVGHFAGGNSASITATHQATTDNMVVALYDSITSVTTNTVTTVVRDTTAETEIYRESHVRNSDHTWSIILSVTSGHTYTVQRSYSGSATGTLFAFVTSL